MSTTLPDHLQTLGAQLDAAWDRRYGSAALRSRILGRRSTQTAILAGAVAAAVAAALVRASGPGAVDQALAAAGTAPADAIVHFTSVSRDRRGALLERTELWGATSPPYARRSIVQGEGAPPIEQGASGDQLTQYDPAGIVYVRTLAGGTAEGTHGADFAADASRVKEYLRDGQARDAGDVTVGGTTLHRFVLSPAGGGTCTYDVQPETFYGVSLTCAGLPTGSTSERWEYLPRQGHERVLSVVAQHPAAHVDRAPIGSCAKARHLPSTPPCIVVAPGA